MLKNSFSFENFYELKLDVSLRFFIKALNPNGIVFDFYSAS